MILLPAKSSPESPASPASDALEKRAPEYRKIIVAISDGQDAKGIFQAQDILPCLVRDQIQFYVVTVSVPVMDRITSTLQNYASTTGEMFIREELRRECKTPLRESLKMVRPGLKVQHRSEYPQYPRHLQGDPSRSGSASPTSDRLRFLLSSFFTDKHQETILMVDGLIVDRPQVIGCNSQMTLWAPPGRFGTHSNLLGLLL